MTEVRILDEQFKRFIAELLIVVAQQLREHSLYLEGSPMLQDPADDVSVTAFLKDLLSLVVRWLNPELSDRLVAVFAGDFILTITRAQPDEAEPESPEQRPN